jgi:mono/diheme cytochrome c family protein
MYRFYFKLFTLFLIVLFPFLFTGCAIEPKKTVPEKYKLGQISFHKVCAQCHGADAMGGKRAPNFLQKKFIPKNFSNARIARTIINGSDSGAMPSQKKRVTPKEIGEIIQYIRYSQKEAGIIS